MVPKANEGRRTWGRWPSGSVRSYFHVVPRPILSSGGSLSGPTSPHTSNQGPGLSSPHLILSGDRKLGTKVTGRRRAGTVLSDWNGTDLFAWYGFFFFYLTYGSDFLRKFSEIN